MATKHAACAAHLMLECGDKVCVVPGINGDKKGAMTEAAKRSLDRFHAYIHKTQAKHHVAELKRPRGDGLIEVEIRGKRYRRRPRYACLDTAPIGKRTEGLSAQISAKPQAKVAIPVSKFHKHTRSCRQDIAAQASWQYKQAIERGVDDAFPPFMVLIADRKRPVIALATCKKTNAPIPEKRVPAAVRMELNRQALADKARAEAIKKEMAA